MKLSNIVPPIVTCVIKCYFLNLYYDLQDVTEMFNISYFCFFNLLSVIPKEVQNGCCVL